MRILTIIILLSAFKFGSAQNYFYSNKELGKGETFGSIIQTGNEYLIIGQDFSTYGKRLVVKTNLNGDTLFSKRYGLENCRYYAGAGKNTLQSSTRVFFAGSRIDYAAGGATRPELFICNSDGDSLFSSDFGRDSMVFNGVCMDQAGYLLLSGGFTHALLGYQGVLIKCDTLGNLIWEKQFGSIGSELFFSVDTTSDGGYVMAGYTGSMGAGLNDVYVVKTDTAGNFLWHHVFGSPQSDAGFCKSISNGNIAVFGGRHVVGKTVQDAFLKVLSPSGGQVLYKEYDYGIDLFNSFYYLIEDDSGFFFAGNCFNGPMTSHDPLIYLVRTDKQGNKLFERTYTVSQNDNYPTALIGQSDGGFVISGYCFPDGSTVLTQDGLLIRANCGGFFDVPQAAFSYLGYPNHEVVVVNQSSNTLLTIIHWGDGTTDTLWYDDPQMSHVYASAGNYSVSIEAQACGFSSTYSAMVIASAIGTEDIHSELLFRIFPNPNNGQFSIDLTGLNETTRTQLQVMDLMGRKVHQQELSGTVPAMTLDDLPNGVYLIALVRDGNVIQTTRFVISR